VTGRPRLTSRRSLAAATSSHADRVESHNAVLTAAQEDALGKEETLVAELTPILEKAGRDAARAFSRRATDHLTAALHRDLAACHGPVRAQTLLRELRMTGLPANPRLDRRAYSEAVEAAGGVTSRSTMVAVKPRPDEAAAIADATGADPANLHVTLAYLGETDGDLEPVAAALRPVAAAHAPLAGVVGGVGAFDDNGNGHPIILLPSVPGLVELRVVVTEALVDADIDYGRQHGFLPHATVDYADPEEDPTDRSGIFDAVGGPLHFDALLVVRGDAETVEIPLVGTPPLTASIDEGGDGITSEIRRVAEKHAPDGGYGDTAWNAKTKTVFWNCADWTTNEEVEAAVGDFLAVDGVERVEHDAEVGMRGTCPEEDGWVIVYAVAQWGLFASVGPVKPVVAVDFDGVLNTHQAGFTENEVVEDPPVRGAADWLRSLTPDFQIVLFSARAADPDGVQAMVSWLNANGFADVPMSITDRKPPTAIAYIDDRAWRFDGRDFPSAADLLADRPWWQTTAEADLPPISGDDADSLAASLAARAAAADEKVTETVARIVADCGGTLAGLEHRRKSPAALAAKITGVAAEKTLTLQAAAADMKDALRYTAVFDTDGYSDGTEDALARLEAAGLAPDRVRNYWLSDTSGGSRYAEGTYLGLNVVLRGLDGYPVEVQFHTPQSLDVQQINWPYYRQLRTGTAPPAEREAMEQQMRENNDFVPKPGRLAALSAASPPPNQPPPWTAPFPNELLDVTALVEALKKKTEATRQAIIESVTKQTIEGVGIAWDITNPLTGLLLAQSGSQIKEIADTTQLNVMRIVGESYDAGLSIPDTAKAIRAGMKEAAPWRARMIARTELGRTVHSASLESVKIVAKATGDAYSKRWLTAPGAPNPRHELYDGLDGQTVPLEQPFQVGDSQLQFPGDPSGDPGETVNCREAGAR